MPREINKPVPIQLGVIPRSRIRDLVATVRPDAEISDHRWAELEEYLSHFVFAAAAFQAFLQKREAKALRAVVDASVALSMAVDAALELGLKVDLDFALEPAQADELQTLLARLAEFDPRSPKNDDPESDAVREERYVWAGRFTNLQFELDQWWTNATCEPSVVYPHKETPFAVFLGIVVACLPAWADFGLSVTKVHERQKANRTRATP